MHILPSLRLTKDKIKRVDEFDKGAIVRAHA
jgi:hypothetical protein